MKIGLYARVSTRDKEQNPEVQLNALRKYALAMEWETYREYVDKASAGDLDGRKEWTQLLEDASRHKFDALLVWKLDRAFRSHIHASTTLKDLNGWHVGFRSYMDPSIDTTTPNGMLVFNVLASVSQFEKDLIVMRINEGISFAREKGTKSGKPIGHPRVAIPDDVILLTFENNGCNFSKTARQLSSDFRVKVSPGFVASRIKRMAGEKTLQTSGKKTAVSGG